jgi:polyisoprenoid-binding protein YceI
MWLAHGAGWQIPLGSGAASNASASAMPPPPVVDDKPGSPADAEADESADEKAETEKAMEEADEGEGDEKKIAVMPLSGWTVSPGGRLGFVASWSGTPVNGNFGRWTSNIKFSPDDLAKSSIRVAVDLASADTVDSQRDEMLRGDSFLNATGNPQAVFTSSAISAKGGDRYQAKGSLSLNGRSRPVTLDFTLKIKDEVARVTGTTRLDRTSFGVGAGEWAATDQIAANVAVNFAFTARKS